MPRRECKWKIEKNFLVDVSARVPRTYENSPENIASMVPYAGQPAAIDTRDSYYFKSKNKKNYKINLGTPRTLFRTYSEKTSI